jgi:hypothetical protein
VLLLLPAALPAEISAPGRTDLQEGPKHMLVAMKQEQDSMSAPFCHKMQGSMQTTTTVTTCATSKLQ